MNVVALVGNLTRDPELKTTRSGHSACAFTLAVDSRRKDDNGERQADFINCVAWDKTAELLCKYTRKGHRLGVEGRLQSRSYDDKDGRRVYVTEVVADHIQFLTQRQDAAPKPAAEPAVAPAAEPAPAPVPPESFQQVSTDELPF